jgi:hypothetical protein
MYESVEPFICFCMRSIVPVGGGGGQKKAKATIDDGGSFV